MCYQLFPSSFLLSRNPFSSSHLFISNNKLRTLPYALAELLTLEVIDCGNNPNLDIVPAQWRGDTEVIIRCITHVFQSVSTNANIFVIVWRER
jgi:Leucine-rich repeat (LRR) protein